MRTRSFRNVVLGAGAMGLATAYHLARRGEPVLLVEQFRPGHDRGSSHGLARITRHSYADPAYARLMIDAFGAWRSLEADAGETVYLRTGGVSISPEGVDYVARVVSSLEAIGVPHRRMSGSEWNARSPDFGLRATDEVVFEPDAGVLLASKVLDAFVRLAREFGGDRFEVMELAPVRRIDLDGERPSLVFDDSVIVADRLIVTAGPWMGRLIPELAPALRPTRQQVLYFRPPDPDRFSVGRFPVFIHKGLEEWDAFYGMPSLPGIGVKVARHGGPDLDLDRLDRSIEPGYVDEIRKFLARTIPSLASSPIDRTEVCVYTMAEGEEFRVGVLPGRPQIVVASPCSGHGFKFSALIGRILADLAVDGGTEVDIAPWRLD